MPVSNEPLKIKSFSAKFESFAQKVICGFMIVIMGFLFLVSFLHTTEMANLPENIESVIYHNDNIIVNFVLICAGLCMFFLLIPKLEKIPIYVLIPAVAVITIVVGVVWVFSSSSAPTEDSFTVTNAAYWASKNDYSSLTDMNYFNYFPFQLGYVFFTEIQIRLFGGSSDTLIYLEVLNVIHLAAAYVGLILILGKLFKSRRVQSIAAILMIFAIQPILFSTFVYGIIPGITFAIYALLFEIMYFQSEKKYAPVWALLSAICIAISTMIKTNNYIVLVALIIIAVVSFIKRLKIVDACYIIVSLVLALSVNSAVLSMYERRADVDIQDGIPFTSWLAMGINESSIASGWYNYTYTLANYEVNNFDTDAASKSSVKAIKERVEYFSKNYQELNDFFYRKVVSQWNEPSYQSIWTNEVRGRYNPMGKIATWVCGKGEPYVKEYMNLYQQIIFLAVLAGTLVLYKKKDILTSMLILVVLGGFLYHMFFEGKSQYIMPYFIIMIAFAAYGISCLYDKKQEYLAAKNAAKASDAVIEVNAEENLTDEDKETAAKTEVTNNVKSSTVHNKKASVKKRKSANSKK